MDDEPSSLYQRVGGDGFFVDLVAAFYRGVADDAALRPLYPEADLGPAEERLRLFLIQYWGGPTTYSDERGHPRLRMRHAPFVIGEAERAAWMRHMGAAVEAVTAERGLDPAIAAELETYFAMAAQHMINAG